MGAAICNDENIAEKLFFIQNSCGAVAGPMDCFLVLEALKHYMLECKDIVKMHLY